jgi:CheY-like chemotaxis protein
MDGFESLHDLKKMNVKIPVIAQTAYAFTNEIERIRQAGFDNNKATDNSKWQK